jgi:P4 family phage/plasmid primase-like protien
MSRATEHKKMEPADYADAYINGRSMFYHQGRTLIHDGRQYREDKELPTKVRRFLIEQGYPHTTHIVNNVVGAIQAKQFIEATGRFASLPFYHCTGEFPKSIIAFRNGLLDVDGYVQGKRELIPHTPDWVSTFCLDFDFDPQANCPQYDDWIAWALPDEPYRNLWHEWGGYCLTPDVSRQRFLLKHGPTGTGKGTTDIILQAVLGKDNCTGYRLRQLARPFGLVPLVDKQAAFIGEVELTSHDNKAQILEVFKSATGGDPQLIEYKGRNDFPSLVIPARFVISCNSWPHFLDETAALARRALPIPFSRQMPLDQQDGSLPARLLSELPGIANRFLDGLTRLRLNNGFSTPAEMNIQLNRMRRDASPALAFLEDRLQVERKLDTGNLPAHVLSDVPQECNAETLREAYSGWLLDSSDRFSDEVKKPAFSWIVRDLRNIIPDWHVEESDRVMVNSRKVQRYFGVGIRPVVE